jgi:hypothetical protein
LTAAAGGSQQSALSGSPFKPPALPEVLTGLPNCRNAHQSGYTSVKMFCHSLASERHYRTGNEGVSRTIWGRESMLGCEGNISESVAEQRTPQPTVGFEPTTSGLQNRSSTVELRWHRDSLDSQYRLSGPYHYNRSGSFVQGRIRGGKRDVWRVLFVRRGEGILPLYLNSTAKACPELGEGMAVRRKDEMPLASSE